MKSIAAVLAVSALVAAVSASSYAGGSAPSSGGYASSMSIPAPPCPQNYLFSCQPNLSPAPCAPSSSAGGYGSSGAYSDNVPTVVRAPYPDGYQSHPNFQQFPNFYGQVLPSYN